ncbi:2-octaprenyl-6-methoxyphenyl hydroxylase [Massilia sp. RP-1-19]|uniref:2-octaprenyl-6-methoxyphenyl hydroxylase n=1 Tax=Massilia polaris TaxID=2728846 RepID=A0A848HS30_9BURK|nr:2-octaprenyl-6-methoxyphenyl hydroxylase [Massilia polaris]
MEAADNKLDVAICGAGPVGMALAALLVKRGMAPHTIALLDARPLALALSDPRSIALSYGSRQLLEAIGAWPVDSTPIHEIHVSRSGHLGRSMIERGDHKVPALGYVARYGDVAGVLASVCDGLGIEITRPARVAGAVEDGDGVVLRLEDGREVGASLAVQAEGGVFGAQEARTRQRDYGQTAVIARVSTNAPISHRAYERFTDEGPLALLPQDGADGQQYALVWCVRPERAEALLALDDKEFLSELGQAFGTRLGRFVGATRRVSYPLGLNADAAATARTVAIGNAAQTLHPVAGQGLNLGLRDAAVLARMLAREATPGVLARFAAERKRDRGLVVGLTDAMARVFASGGRSQALLGLALGVLDTVGPARTLLAETMMFGHRAP